MWRYKKKGEKYRIRDKRVKDEGEMTGHESREGPVKLGPACPPLPPPPPSLSFNPVVVAPKIFRDEIGMRIDLLSIEKASAAASAASATSSSTPRESRPMTTLFLLTVVSFLPSFHHCVRAHHHHPVCSIRHHRCQPLDTTSFFSPSLARPLAGFLFLPLSVSLSPVNIDQQQ